MGWLTVGGGGQEGEEGGCFPELYGTYIHGITKHQIKYGGNKKFTM